MKKSTVHKKWAGCLAIALLFFFSLVQGQQMSISTAPSTVNPQGGVVLDLSQNPGTTAGASARGFLLPMLNNTQMNNISSSAPAGLIIFNTSAECYEIYSGSVWNPFWCLCTTGGTCTAGAASTTVCTGSTISLTSTSGFSSYSWTGPGGFTSTLQNPTTSQSSAGSYTYTVTASNGCGSTTPTTVTITVVAGVTQSAGVTASPICQGSTINLTCTDNSADVTAYSWSGPNSFSSASQNPSITNAQPAATGTYTVSCTESAGCIETSTVSVVVNATPNTPSAISQIDPLTGGSYTGPCSTGCIAVGQHLIYEVSNTSGATYNWTVANGTILSGATTNEITVNWTGAGSNEITVTQTINGCTGPAQDLYVTVSSTCSCTYTTCASSSTFVVPSGISSLTLDVSGAEGGHAWGYSQGSTYQTSPNTDGANVQCTYATSAGTTLYCNVGCVGGNGSSSAGGLGGVGGNSDENGGNASFPPSNAFGGGYAQSAAFNQTAAGGGGGASDIRVGTNTLANRVVVAGGGGGDFWAWSECCNGCHGEIYTVIDNYFPTLVSGGTGCGGNADGANGGYNYCSGVADEYGYGGSTSGSHPGAGAPATGIMIPQSGNCPNNSSASCSGVAGTAGSGGNGGNGGYQGAYLQYYGVCEYSSGSGGGGGYYGGGGGAGGGGGGGSSYAGAGTSGVSYVQCSQTGNGSITITW